MSITKNQESPINPEIHLIVLLVLFYVFTSLIMPHGGHFLDMPTWADWIIYMREHGIRHIYDLYAHPLPGQEPGFVYGPVYMYLLYFYGKFQGSANGLKDTIYQFKSVILLFDVVGMWFALRYLPNKVNRPFYALFLIFNIGLLYDTVGWAQNDSAIACLMLIAVHYALKGRLTISGISILVALLIKPQPIVFLPAFGLLWLPVLAKLPISRALLTFLTIGVVGIFLLSPFLITGTAIDYWTMLRNTTSLHPFVSIRAANIWPLLLTEDPFKILDRTVRFGLTYRQWGLLMFSIGYGVILFPLARQTYQYLTGRINQFDTATILLTFALIPIVFYFFNTQIHERYAHPCLLFLAAYAFCKGDFVPYIIASIANFWVMEKGIWELKLYRLYGLITLEQLAVLFLFVLLWGIVKLYKKPSEHKILFAKTASA